MAQTLTQVREWNAGLQALKPEMVAVFVEATSGIGKQSAIKLASAVDEPVIHIIGRNEVAGAQVIEAMKIANPRGTYSFKSVDVSNLRLVDKACNELKSQFETDSGIDQNHMLRYYSRMRFIVNLLPALQASRNSRVISILAAGKEIMIEEDNLDLEKFSLSAGNGYPASMTSLAFEKLAAQNPSISFLHVFPGIMATPLMKTSVGFLMGAVIGFLLKPISISVRRVANGIPGYRPSPTSHPRTQVKVPIFLTTMERMQRNKRSWLSSEERDFPKLSGSTPKPPSTEFWRGTSFA
ncbi:short-chain dehydrogenases/reductase [Penicillium malachiteum]|uniref:short-chain dehydrogenases/reductase n=1 Tax=Penicillium malachiteum TaxID=1324776 RepID=UPI0025482312|nr:short-chain dehydrogenases/reductase [Penicillium malachiteum]KAJ5725558.1 short-chain dehydrogenases/reductase [Penicillium malachiteum]